MKKRELIEVLKSEGFSDFIIKAFEKVKRENFVSEKYKKYAYENEPLPIGPGATISQPYTIAFMLDLMELDDLGKADSSVSIINKKQEKVSKREKHKLYNMDINETKILEIGSGSGYVLALINEILKNTKINCDIYGIEINKSLVDKSKKVLKNYKNIKIVYGDGKKGLKEYEKYDRILISAACDELPNNLYEQLNNKGVLICPVRNSIFQIRKLNDKDYRIKEFPGFIFVPLI